MTPQDIAGQLLESRGIAAVVSRSIAKESEWLIKLVSSRVRTAQTFNRHDGVSNGLGQRHGVNGVASTGQPNDVRRGRRVRNLRAYVRC